MPEPEKKAKDPWYDLATRKANEERRDKASKAKNAGGKGR